ncbi:MAG: hypothetical protein RL134_621 [Actinomycetota bacterium]
MGLNRDRTPTQAIPGPKCSVCIALITMDKTDRETLQSWLDNEHLRSLELMQWLQADGITHIGQQAIQRHRRGACSGRARGLV